MGHHAKIFVDKLVEFAWATRGLVLMSKELNHHDFVLSDWIEKCICAFRNFLWQA